VLAVRTQPFRDGITQPLLHRPLLSLPAALPPPTRLFIHTRHSQQICFGLQTPQDIMKCGVLHVYERSLYKVRLAAASRAVPALCRCGLQAEQSQHCVGAQASRAVPALCRCSKQAEQSQHCVGAVAVSHSQQRAIKQLLLIALLTSPTHFASPFPFLQMPERMPHANGVLDKRLVSRGASEHQI